MHVNCSFYIVLHGNKVTLHNWIVTDGSRRFTASPDDGFFQQLHLHQPVLQCCMWVCFFGGFMPNNNNDSTGMTSSVNLWPPPAEISPNLWRHHHPYAPVKSSAVLTGGGIRPAAVTLRSLVRKLKVAHAFGCNTAEVEMRDSNIK